MGIFKTLGRGGIGTISAFNTHNTGMVIRKASGGFGRTSGFVGSRAKEARTFIAGRGISQVSTIGMVFAGFTVSLVTARICRFRTIVGGDASDAKLSRRVAKG